MTRVWVKLDATYVDTCGQLAPGIPQGVPSMRAHTASSVVCEDQGARNAQALSGIHHMYWRLPVPFTICDPSTPAPTGGG